VIFGLAEVLGAEEFLSADDLSASFGSALDCGEGLFEIGGGIGGTGRLNEADGDFVLWWHKGGSQGFSRERTQRAQRRSIPS